VKRNGDHGSTDSSGEIAVGVDTGPVVVGDGYFRAQYPEVREGPNQASCEDACSDALCAGIGRDRVYGLSRRASSAGKKSKDNMNPYQGHAEVISYLPAPWEQRLEEGKD
jgi:hypothetical protein